MLSRPGTTEHTINLFRQELDDDDLTCLFEAAASTAPAIFALEDIDQCFEPKSGKGHDAEVSLQHLHRTDLLAFHCREDRKVNSLFVTSSKAMVIRLGARCRSA